MPLTDHQAKYLAYELTRRHPSDSVEKLATALVDAQVDLNPHQVDAALFAFSSPLSRGALLADEVGLGKTIEAGLVLSQKWAERRRRILVITPANLRKQWQQELSEKFFLPSRLLEAKSYGADVKQGRRPFASDAIVICSYEFARSKEADVTAVPWDLVVIDEAHRLRNVYKPANVTANALKRALAHSHKLLLTATPLQNSLLELYGLVSFIDEYTFGDVQSFRDQFTNLSQDEAFATLKARLRPICHRTLRRQVEAYVSYTKRLPIVQDFSPDDSEQALYEMVSEYLRRPNLQALPSGQRSLLTLVLRKLLASSTFAIAGALRTIADRLRARLGDRPHTDSDALAEQLDEDYEALDETAEEWPEQSDEAPLSTADRLAIEREIVDLEAFSALAGSIQENAKGRALLTALDVGFAKARVLGAAEKAIIFTESRRTQDYLLQLLAGSRFGEGIVLFNGSNTDERSKAIYTAWLARHRGTDRVTGSRAADMRSALVDYFRDQGRIMIATEAAAEGINLQFCALVVNYDLPWNPQRIEQRIGRCHRYGQKHDVVVVNFVNRRNAADERVFELLSEKFHLFAGVFGASDEVLGAIESGVDFEKRIADIYQHCRQPAEIRAAFDQLQRDLSAEIGEAMTATRRKLLEHFDDEVREKLRTTQQDSHAGRNRVERELMQLTQHELRDHAEFLGDGAFRLEDARFGDDVPSGLYELPRRSGESHLYRVTHPLAQALIDRAKRRDTPAAAVRFDYGRHDGKVTVLESLVGRSGWLTATCIAVESPESGEDHIVLASIADGGEAIDEDVLRRLLGVPAETVGSADSGAAPMTALDMAVHARQAAIERRVAESNGRYFEAEVAKLEGWADDRKSSLEREIKELDRQTKEARRAATTAQTLDEKVAGQKAVKALESRRNEKRRALFDAQDEVDRQREAIIAEVEAKLAQQTRVEPLFTIRWSVA